MKILSDNVMKLREWINRLEYRGMYISIHEPAFGHDSIEIWYSLDNYLTNGAPNETHELYFFNDEAVDELADRLERLHNSFVKESRVTA